MDALHRNELTGEIEGEEDDIIFEENETENKVTFGSETSPSRWDLTPGSVGILGINKENMKSNSNELEPDGKKGPKEID